MVERRTGVEVAYEIDHRYSEWLVCGHFSREDPDSGEQDDDGVADIRWVEEAELVACIKRSAPRRGLDFETLFRQELQMYTDGTAATLQRVNDAEKDAEAAAAAAAAAAPAAPAQRAAAPAAAERAAA